MLSGGGRYETLTSDEEEDAVTHSYLLGGQIWIAVKCRLFSPVVDVQSERCSHHDEIGGRSSV